MTTYGFHDSHEQHRPVDVVYCFNVNREPRAFIDAFGERVLPQLRGA